MALLSRTLLGEAVAKAYPGSRSGGKDSTS